MTNKRYDPANLYVYAISSKLFFQIKIERKRHLGNDIVVCVFKEGNTNFTPEIVKSVFNRTYYATTYLLIYTGEMLTSFRLDSFVVVSEEQGGQYYKVGVATKDGVSPYGPALPYPPLIPASELGNFMLTKSKQILYRLCANCCWR